jgi:hypothetical protein
MSNDGFIADIMQYRYAFAAAARIAKIARQAGNGLSRVGFTGFERPEIFRRCNARIPADDCERQSRQCRDVLSARQTEGILGDVRAAHSGVSCVLF